MSSRLEDRAAELAAHRQPFVRATVVRAQAPTSVRPGDRALVLGDGTIEGFVGGSCAAESVRTAALASLHGGESVLLRVLPEDGLPFPESPGATQSVNPCLSGGALEIFLEPAFPAPLLEVVGDTPTAGGIASVAGVLGFAVDQRPSLAKLPEGTVAVVVATHGRDEPEAIRAALDAGVGFVGLVASHVRGEAVLEAMGLSPLERARVHTPVGLPIGARTAEEIGLSVMAAVVRAIRVDGVTAPVRDDAGPVTAVDPVCGMTVVVGPETPHLAVDGEDVWFCAPGCRERWAAGRHAGV